MDNVLSFSEYRRSREPELQTKDWAVVAFAGGVSIGLYFAVLFGITL